MASKQITVKLSCDSTQFDVSLTKSQLRVIESSANMGAALKNLANASKASFKDAGDAANKFGDSARHQVSSVQALGGAIRGLDGSMNVRAAERFLSSFSAISKLATLAFPVFGLLAVGDVLVSLGKKAYEAYQALQQMATAPQRIAASFRSINDPLRQGNDELAIANDRLQMEIDKLQGKPSNGLKLALDEAVASADKLATSLDKDLTSLNKLLQENSVPWYAQLLGKAGTGALKTELGGDDGLGGFSARVNAINDAGGDKIRALRDRAKPGDDAKTQAANAKAVEDATKDLNTKLAAAYKDEIDRLNAILKDAQSPKSVTSVNRAGRTTTSQVDPASKSYLIANTQGALRQIKEQYDDITRTGTNDALTKKKDALTDNASAENLTRPFQDKTKELAVQIDGLRDKLKAVGQDGTAEVMAKAYADWKAELAHLNDELAKHHTALTQAQSDQLKSQFVTIETTKAELEWQETFKKSTTTINDKVSSYQRLTDAIGQGAAAQRAATIEDKLQSALGTKANDPAWLTAHASDVSSLRSGIGNEYDAQQEQKTAGALDSLSRQTDLQNALTIATAKGSEAVREANLQAEIAEIVQNNDAASAQKLIAATLLLASAKEKVNQASIISNLEQETAATERLTAAQLQGAQAVRDAALANRIEQIKRSTIAGSPEQSAQIGAATNQAQAAHQLEIAQSAIRTGIAYTDQLQSLKEQQEYLEQQKALGNDSLALEISLKEIEQERVKIWSDMTDKIGTAKQGMQAYFDQMATSGLSAAKQVQEVLSGLTNGFNDQIGKLVSGEKTSWASFFKGQSANAAKGALQTGEAQLAKALGFGGKADGSKANPFYVLSGDASGAASGGGVLGGIFGKKKSSGDAYGGGDGDIDPDDDSDDDDSGGGSVLSGIGGFFKNLLGSIFGGHHASGGIIPSGTVGIVGEQGTEAIYNSSGSGMNVIPHNQLGTNSGGHTFITNVDARNSDNAAETEMRVRKAIAASHAKAVHEATMTVQEISKRRPRG